MLCFRSPGLSSWAPLYFSWCFIAMILVIMQHIQYNDLIMAWNKVVSATDRTKCFLSSPQCPDQSGAHPVSFSIHIDISPLLLGSQEAGTNTYTSFFLYFVDRASHHNFLLITNLMHLFMHLFIHFISLHVSSIKCSSSGDRIVLTFRRRNFLLNFSTPCI